jgi:hypothetical protein
MGKMGLVGGQVDRGLEGGRGPRDGFAERGLRQETGVRGHVNVGCAGGASWDVNDFFSLSVGVGVVIMGSRRMGCFGVGRRSGLRSILRFVGGFLYGSIPQISG